MKRRRTSARKKSGTFVITLVEIAIIAVVLAACIWLAARLLGYRKDAKQFEQLRQNYKQTVQTQQADKPVQTEIRIDFDTLKQTCPDVVGWLTVDGVPEIDYPIMQGATDDDYLRTSPDGKSNLAGSIFLESRNSGFDDCYAIVYGHHMQDSSMFTRLLDYKSEDFYKNGTGLFTIITPSAGGENITRHYKIFAAGKVPDNSEVYTMGFEHNDTFAAFIDKLCAQSAYSTGIKPTKDDNIVTLSTCATVGGDGRFIVCGVQVD